MISENCRSYSLAIGLTVLLTGSPVLAQFPTALTDTALPEPIFWKQTRFVIPYQWAGGADQSTAKSVRLYISKDQGTSWQPISEGMPHARGFTYHAEEDGEYWFAIRTVDQEGQMWPAGPLQPELRVIVDTTLPQIDELGGLLAKDGSLQIYWKATDARLKQGGLKIEYRTQSSEAWQPIQIDEIQLTGGAVSQGNVQWTVAPGIETLSLRAELYDAAGNRSFRGAEISASYAHLPSDGQFPMIITGRDQLSANVIRSNNLPLQAQSSVPQTKIGKDYVNPFLTPGATVSSSTISPDGWRVPEAATGLQAPALTKTNSPQGLAQAAQTWPADVTRQAAGESQLVVNKYVQPAPRIDSLHSTTPATSDATTGSATPSDNTMMVGSRTFDLDYDIDASGALGIARVELWGTRDGGQSWRIYALDDDNRSPLRVSVEGEGTYGFKIVAQSAAGMAAAIPQPGQAPELLVAVDLAKPTAELLSVQQGTSNLSDHLLIRWRAADENLGQTPIALFYGSRAAGPWSAVATGLENTGEYTWRLQRHLPTEFYLRLEARDRAGNLTASQTPAPITLQRAQPTARIRGVSPTGPQAAYPAAVAR